MDVQHSEVKFFELIDDLNDDWLVWHSVEWQDDSKMKIGEADFLIFHPEYGFLVIEVKGGIISFENDIFYSRNQRTREKHKIKDPFSQARKSAFFFHNHYKNVAKIQKNKNKLLDSYEKGYRFPLSFNYGVFFPDSYFKDALPKNISSVRTPSYKIFDKSDCDKQDAWRRINYKLNGPSPLQKFLIGLLDVYKAKRSFRREIKEFFPKIISPKIATVYRIGQYLEEKGKELEEINSYQDYLLNVLVNKKRCIFRGSAGTGKTFIAMKKTLMNYNMNISTLFICFNRELKEFVKSYFTDKIGKDYINMIKVCTVNSLLINLTKNFIMKKKQAQILKSISEFEFKSAAEEILGAVAKDRIIDSFKFDSLIIDEAQDINKCLWDLFIYFIKDVKNSIYYIFYDPEQSIFVKKVDLERSGFDKEGDLLFLNKNLRNSTRIAKWLKKKTNLGNYEEFSGIDGFLVKEYSQFANPYAALKEILNEFRKNLLRASVETDKIALLSYFRIKNLFSNDVKHNELCDFLVFDLKNKDGDLNGKLFVIEPYELKNVNIIKDRFKKIYQNMVKNINFLLYETITSFKGLERDVIFLLIPNIERFRVNSPDRFENLKMQIYVGASRAKFKLYLYEFG